MLVLVISTLFLKEQMKELQRKLGDKGTKITNLAISLANRECKKTNKVQ